MPFLNFKFLSCHYFNGLFHLLLTFTFSYLNFSRVRYYSIIFHAILYFILCLNSNPFIVCKTLKMEGRAFGNIGKRNTYPRL